MASCLENQVVMGGIERHAIRRLFDKTYLYNFNIDLVYT